MTYFFLRFLRVGLSLATIAVVVFLSLAIISYNNTDPSFLNAKATVLKTHNICGKSGAVIADPILQTIGYAVVLPLLFFLIFAIKLLNNAPNKYFVYRSIALLLGVIMSSVMFAFISESFITNNVNLGGIVGDYLKQMLLTYFSNDLLLMFLASLFIPLTIFYLGLTFSEWRLIYKYGYRCISFCIKVIKWIVHTTLRLLKWI